MKYPYGLSNYKTIITDGLHFVDKTVYISLLEDLSSRFNFLLRPRRFGKSLFVSMLRYYYGLEHKNDFEQLFGHLDIGHNPTPKANAYRCLFFEFSGIDTSSPENVYTGFLGNVCQGIRVFIETYGPFKGAERILGQESPNGMLRELMTACQNDGGAPVYVFIDEYDHFANEVLAFDYASFSKMMTGNGFVRKFYEMLKRAAGEGVIGRMFVTGVTPITLDSLTSGFNIGADLTLDPRFNACLGFGADDVLTMLEGAGAEDKEKALGDMRGWYNGYRFSVDAEEKVYNPDMVLYFIKNVAANGMYPRNIVDQNIATDYGKMGRLFNLLTPESNYAVLEEVVSGKEISSGFTERFSFERPFTRKDFISMLYYMGFLTIKGISMGFPSLGVPNYVIKRLYIDFAADRLDERAGLGLRAWDASSAMLALVRDNDLKPLFDKLQETLKKLSTRDAVQFDEKHLKMVLVSLVNLTDVYFIKSESEVYKKFADVVLATRPPVYPNWQYAFELKYVKKGEAKNAPKALEQAKKQLTEYWQSVEWQAEGNLRAYAVVFVYDELYALEEVKPT